MNVIDVFQVSKSFRGTRAVHDLSFGMAQGEIFGMVGPNGAGKTTTLRMLMDIIRPDSGEIEIFGQSIEEQTKNRIGYLPEERGLYKKNTVLESLVYLGALKGVSSSQAKERAAELLERVGMVQHKDKKVEELSRGMGQIIQLIVTILHNPELIVLDEPFAGLDPVNTELLKGFILEQRDQGKSIILSTHMMNQIEELCDRVLMINKGEAVLYGSLIEIKSRFRSNSVFLKCDSIPEELPGVVGRKEHAKYTELFLDQHTQPSQIIATLINRGVTLERFEISTPSLNEIFIKVAKGG
ncbi:MAG TPA: ATP-binding cassette domain-containing protein [Dehalococcoidia bacterium]|nr:ATP-binding cassette domain-containing protein [Dehalococcoidia bacterium]